MANSNERSVILAVLVEKCNSRGDLYGAFRLFEETRSPVRAELRSEQITLALLFDAHRPSARGLGCLMRYVVQTLSCSKKILNNKFVFSVYSVQKPLNFCVSLQRMSFVFILCITIEVK